MLRVAGLTVRYGDATALRDVHLEAADGEVLCVLGPSGCGKSTLLRAVAGLAQPSAGTIEVDGRDLAGVRPDRREVGLMFQDHALFPHRTVAENVAFGPRMRGLRRDAVARRVTEVLALVDLVGFEERRVTELSGGEQQRVALARAVAPSPRLLMLDEPLGSLDRRLRDRLVDELSDVFARLGTTVVYVTHDQDEALALADRVAVLRDGEVLQVGAPLQLWRAPTHEFTARFLGNDQVLDAQVAAGIAATPLGRLPVAEVADGQARLVLLPDALRLLEAGTPVGDAGVALAGTVEAHRFAGDHVRVRVRLDADHGGVVVTVAQWRGSPPPVGTSVTVALDPTAVRAVVPEQPPAPEGGPEDASASAQ